MPSHDIKKVWSPGIVAHARIFVTCIRRTHASRSTVWVSQMMPSAMSEVVPYVQLVAPA